MGKKSEPVITKCKVGENWTKVTFKPDLEKFKMDYLEEDVVALMKKRVVDMAGCLGKTVKVELNGQVIRMKSFRDYADLYLKSVEKSRPVPLPRFVSMKFVFGASVISSFLYYYANLVLLLLIGFTQK